MSTLRPTDPSLFFTKNDPDDPRLGELAGQGAPALEVFGWADDEGIRLNGGRPGAAEAPARIRRFLYRMTPSATGTNPKHWIDRGDLPPEAPLAERHANARRLISQAQTNGRTTMSFGGGHDYGFPDAAGFLEATLAKSAKRPVVVNFDAHLDVRPADKSLHSGTPFRRLLEEFKDRFDFLEIGLQDQCNSRAHATWAREHGAELWWLREARGDELLKRARAYAQARAGAPLFVSLDLDVLTSRSAPGCSQSWDTGLETREVFDVLEIFGRSLAWQGFGLYEVSPPLDTDDRTAKLAAQFAFTYLHHQGPA